MIGKCNSLFKWPACQCQIPSLARFTEPLPGSDRKAGPEECFQAKSLYHDLHVF